MAESFEVIWYEKGDPNFRNPEYKSHISHVLLFIFGVLTFTSQIALTLGVLPGSFWPIPLAAFLGGMMSYIWIYYAMEHR